MKLLTVSIAAYHVEDYLRETLDSFLIPEVTDQLEVLIVNDGSGEGVNEIAREYQTNYPDVFRLIDKENGGHGSTVNRGIEEAAGKYFKTVDGDDYVSAEGLKAIAPGVMAQTGMETARILLGIIKEVQPDLVIAIDALAARSIRRLGTTIQLTDTGIHPGSGVGNHRRGMTRENLGVPVIAIGVPTVVGAAAIVHGTVNALVRTLTASKEGSRYGEYIRELDSDSQYELIRELLEPEFGAMFVTPQDMDERICKLSAAIAEGIRRAVERLEEER